MKIVLFTHPSFLGSQSMPKYAGMLMEGMIARGHEVEIWSPQERLHKLKLPASLRKWLGYVDQFIVFPAEIKERLRKAPQDTLFVFTDQALGPWVPLVQNRPHVIHCHDFLAQLSALGQIKENITGKTGRIYQWYIRKGYNTGKHFISVSKKTQDDLHSFLNFLPSFSEVVYNGLNQSFQGYAQDSSRNRMKARTGIDLSNGYLLHIGGNQWYKNRVGVIKIYDAWRRLSSYCLPLLLVGPKANVKVLKARSDSSFKKDIHLLTGFEDEIIPSAYAGASVFLFPSLAEGFGWPIAEAMAAGTPVITTNEAPMTEVAGNAAFLIPRMPDTAIELESWSLAGATLVDSILKLDSDIRSEIERNGLANAQRFDPNASLDKIERIYRNILNICNN